MTVTITAIKIDGRRFAKFPAAVTVGSLIPVIKSAIP